MFSRVPYPLAMEPTKLSESPATQQICSLKPATPSLTSSVFPRIHFHNHPPHHNLHTSMRTNTSSKPPRQHFPKYLTLCHQSTYNPPTRSRRTNSVIFILSIEGALRPLRATTLNAVPKKVVPKSGADAPSASWPAGHPDLPAPDRRYQIQRNPMHPFVHNLTASPHLQSKRPPHNAGVSPPL